jgi:hypothetical protein
LSRDELRVLIITFIGGLASILVGAVVVGVAVALAQQVQQAASLLSFAAITGALALVSALNIAWIVISVRLSVMRSNRLMRMLGSVAHLIMLAPVMLLCVCILTWIGIAAGVH